MNPRSPYSLRRLFILFLLSTITLTLYSLPAHSQEPAVRPLDLLIDFQQFAAAQVDSNANAGAAPVVLAEIPDTVDSSSPASTDARAMNTTVTELPSWSRIIFQSRRSGRWDIYSSTPDGATTQQLTEGATLNIQPALERGGGRFLYISNRVKRDKLSLQIMNIDGTNNYALTGGDSDDSYPSWSPDRYQIAFTSSRDNNNDIYRVNADKSDLRRLTYEEGYDGQPSWSPDGSQIVFTSNRTGTYALWRMKADGSEQTQLTDGAPALFPAWSPLGDKIAFAADTTADGFLELWQMDADGKNFEMLVENYGQYDVWQPTWSPGGEWLAYQITTWYQQEGTWVWNSSYMEVFQESNSALQPIIDNQLWRPQWGTFDATAPNACTPQVAAQQTKASFLVTLNATDVGDAGIDRFEVATRTGAGAPWVTSPELIQGPAFVYEGPETQHWVEFRCRARDAALNWAPWTAQPTAATTVDASYPHSVASVSTGQVRGNQAAVRWQGTDPGGTIAGYDIWLRSNPDGIWERWLQGTTASQATLTGKPGTSYEIRSQAVDATGHREPWQPAAHTSVHFYDHILTALVLDSRANQAGMTGYQLTPTVAATQLVSPTTELRLYLGDQPTYQLTVDGGPSTLPPAKLTVRDDMTIRWVVPPADEQLENGNFEADVTNGWQLVGDGVSRAEVAHTGAYAALLKRTAAGQAGIRQRVRLDEEMQNPTLSWLKLGGIDSGNFVVQVQTALSTTVVYQEPGAPEVSADWSHHWVDLADYLGEEITISLAISDGVGQVRLDEVSIGSWRTPQPTAVAPTTWQSREPVQLTITGTNFLSTSQVYLGATAIDQITWISPTQLQVMPPTTLRQGAHDLFVISPDGAVGVQMDAVTVTAHEILLPLIQNRYATRLTEGNADWPMLAHNPGRTAYNAKDPGASAYALAWDVTMPVDGSTLGALLVAVGNDVVATVHQPAGMTSILVLDAESGEQRWQTTHRYGYRISAPTVAHGTVYYVGEEGSSGYYLFAFDLKSGSELWRAPIVSQSQLDLSPTVFGNRVFFHSGYTGGIQSISAGSGATLWTRGLEVYEDRALAFGSGLLFGTSRQGIHVISPTTGQSVLLHDYHYFGRYLFPIVTERRILVGGVTALDRQSGALVWQHTESGPSEFSVVDEEGILYRVANGTIEAIDTRTGQRKWSMSDQLVEMVTAGAGNYLYATAQGRTIVIDRRTQQVVEELPHTGLSIVANGYLYGATDDGHIYAYRAQLP